MSRIYSRRRRRGGAVEINMAPLIDMIFILLIFFLVTASFMKESGLSIQRPTAQSAEIQEKTNVIIEITENDTLFIEGKSLDIRSLRGRIERLRRRTPGLSVLIVADKRSETGTTIQVLDACRLAGVQNVGVAARRTAP